jgi:surfactin synthase thioesterase subunit
MMLVPILFVACLSASYAYDSQFNLNAAKRYVTLCGASYCTDPVIVQNHINDWSCHACQSYPNMKATVFHGSVTDANGYVGYDPDSSEIIVAFAGTDPFSIENWIDDLDFIQTDYPYCSGCKVHEGFYRSYSSVNDQVRSLVNSYQSQYPNATLAITGHSLGAAMAAHCGAALIESGYKVKTIYAYGMPRVGNEAFEKWYQTRLPGTFRMSHWKDPVPHLPFEKWNFHHMPYEVFYTQDYNAWKLCSLEGEDSSCANKYAVDANVGE